MDVKIIYKSEEIFDALKSNIISANEIRIATGYFSNKIFDMFKDEFKHLIDDNGKFKLIIGADATADSIAFFQAVLNMSKEEFLTQLSTNYFENFKNLSTEALQVVFDLFDRNILEVKVGIANDGGIFHVKEYIFENEDYFNHITGSLNFTQNALLSNHESIQYFSNHETFHKLKELFDKRWNNLLETVSVVEVNDFLAEECIEELSRRGVKVVRENEVGLRDYQKEAIEELLKYKFNGFLEMATGTGKTFTAISGLNKYTASSNKFHFILVIVPYKHLVTQWISSLKTMLDDDVDVFDCHSSTNWKEVFGIKKNKSKKSNVYCVMISDTLFANFDSIIELISSTNNILIYDEAHNLTKDNLDKLNDYKQKFVAKVGLSATPNNYLDKARTDKLFRFFDGAYFKFELERAIEEGYLTKYNYYPHIIDLESDEINEYRELQRAINLAVDDGEKLELLKKQSDVLSKARNKINKLKEVIEKLDKLEYTLVYCNPGGFKTEELAKRSYIEQITEDLYKTKFQPKIRKITSSESIKERKRIVDLFKIKEVDVILAIKCLDEGYDIPPVRQAFILYSTRNPSEFIQRRGRVLRLSEGKDIAYIHDFVVRVDKEIPPEEKARFIEYYSVSNNKENLEEFRKYYIGEHIDE